MVGTSTNFDHFEGYSSHLPPLQDRTNYAYRKNHMAIWITSQDLRIWDVIECRNYVPTKITTTKVDGIDKIIEEAKPRKELAEEDYKKVYFNHKAVNYLHYEITQNDYIKISMCTKFGISLAFYIPISGVPNANSKAPPWAINFGHFTRLKWHATCQEDGVPHAHRRTPRIDDEGGVQHVSKRACHTPMKQAPQDQKKSWRATRQCKGVACWTNSLEDQIQGISRHKMGVQHAKERACHTPKKCLQMKLKVGVQHAEKVACHTPRVDI
ncbi:hypothetical protein Ahy_B10g102902 [Arachis hypogaea]|uniref:Uncharacterized protein n=1 Tax=Arachis hypogaea TaxID=3818 RepID=A0A444X2R1_ARAHY|nr:hypothetical protein Ahy_B10g102902 [Arachis hypogaea]